MFELVALLKRTEDAEVWHANPASYVNSIRRVRIRPAPIEVLEPGQGDYETALELLEAIARGPDSRIGETLERINRFLERLHL